ncbi:MAG: zf-TFIIB domain-containing protein [Anaerolineae bacterium]|nr:zf-TFIIB domain-containing protein [Anaerolineae bacterium]
MNCPNCGAPLRPGTNFDFLWCEYCGTFQFPVPSLDGIKTLGQGDGDLRCPLCRDHLSTAVVAEISVLHCQHCQGFLTGRRTFFDIVKYQRARIPATLHSKSLNDKALERELWCPQCSCRMQTFAYCGPGNVVIDTCDRCDLIWLDYGELHRVVSTIDHSW